MYKDSGIQKKARKILENEIRKPSNNAIGVTGFILTLLALVNLTACVTLFYFYKVDAKLIRDNLDIYSPLILVLIGILVLGFVFSLIGTFVGYHTEKYRLVKAKTTLCVVSTALSVIVFIAIANLLIKYIFVL